MLRQGRHAMPRPRPQGRHYGNRPAGGGYFGYGFRRRGCGIGSFVFIVLILIIFYAITRC
jgi:hypothetical protein